MKQITLILIAALAFGLSSCKKEIPATFEVNDHDVLPDNALKDKLKTPEQYVTVAYANLFQKALSISELLEITDVIMSIGDKEIAREVLISNFMNNPDVQLPTDAEMRGNIDQFIEDAHKRFFVRLPSELEVAWMKNYLNSHPDLSAEIVYFSYAMANEYLFY